MDEDRITLARVEATLESVAKALGELREDVLRQRGDVVPRGEWLQRNAYVDSKFDNQGADISEIRQDLAAKRAPWWVVLAAGLGVLGFLWTVLGPVLTAAQ
jgi:hypothetical protein